MLGAVMFASKTLFEAVPNIHPLTMLIAVYTVVYRKKAIFPLLIYLVLDTVKWGPLTMVPYWYIFPLAWLCILAVPQKNTLWVRQICYTVICTAFGLLFGTLYAPWAAVVFLKSFDMGKILSWIAAGLPYDFIHAAGTFAASLLIIPLVTVLKRIEKQKAT